METLLDGKMIKQYEEETNEYIRKKKVDKLFDLILKHVLINKPENIYMYIYNNIYHFLLNKIFIIGPPLLKITSHISSLIAKTFNYYYISTYHLVKEYTLKNEDSDEDSPNRILVNDTIVTSLVKTAISSIDPQKKKGYVVEGYPRNNLQAHQCIDYIPSHIIVLYADEKYIYEKYEEENYIKLFDNEVNNITWDKEHKNITDIGKEENEKNEKNEEITPPLFEMKELDLQPLKDRVNLYSRNISDILEVFDILKNKKHLFNLREINEDELTKQIMNLVGEDDNKWAAVKGETSA